MNDKNLLPFSLDKAKEGYKIVTRSGIVVTEWTAFKSVNVFPIVGVVGTEAKTWRINGTYDPLGYEHDLDLFLITRATTVYRNVYADASDCINWNSLDEAKHNIELPFDHIAILSLTTTENNPKPKVQIVHEY